MWEYRNDAQGMRDALMKVMLGKRLTIATLSNDIGLSRGCLDKFLEGDSKLQLMTKLRVCDYIEKNKKYLDEVGHDAK